VQTVRDQTTGALKELSIFVTERVQLFALGIKHSEDVAMIVPHRDDDLGARSMKCG
jgi:hypothetical protein